jgi:hypothetical protein
MRLGLDFGRVIHGGPLSGGTDSDFLHGPLAAALASTAVPDMWETVPALVDLFDGRVWIVSKCGGNIERRTLAWLRHHRFYDRTGVPEGNVRFCRQRPEKARHAAELGLTHFVDDRADVLAHLDGLVAHRYLFGPQDAAAAPGVTATLTWPDLLTAVRTSGR